MVMKHMSCVNINIRYFSHNEHGVGLIWLGVQLYCYLIFCCLEMAQWFLALGCVSRNSSRLPRLQVLVPGGHCFKSLSQSFDLRHKVWSLSQAIMAKNRHMTGRNQLTNKYTDQSTTYFFCTIWGGFISNRLYHNNRSVWKKFGAGVSVNAWNQSRI